MKIKLSWITVAACIGGLFYLSQQQNMSPKVLQVSLKQDIPGLLTDLKSRTKIPKELQVSVNAPGLTDSEQLALKETVLSRLGSVEVPVSEDYFLISLKQDGRQYLLNLVYYPTHAVPFSVLKRGTLFLWESLIPPVLAICLAMLFQKVFLALGVAIGVGAGLMGQGMVTTSLQFLGVHYAWDVIRDPSHIKIYLFTLFMLAMVGILTYSGAMAALIAKLLALAKSRLSIQRTTFGMGLLVFFDDYANTFLVGSTMKPFFDRAKVSRAKLAYLVDSTAAPVAGLAVVSTWIAYEVSQLDMAFSALSLSYDGFVMFLNALPYRFYCWMTLLFIVFNVWLGRDYGPMYTSERKAIQEPEKESQIQKTTELSSVSIWVAILPVGFLLLAMPLLMLWEGWGSSSQSIMSLTWLQETFGNADSPKVMVIASGMALLLAALLSWGTKTQSITAVGKSLWKGVINVLPALGILTLAWSIQSVCNDVGVARYVMALVGDHLSPFWIAPVIFLVSAGISFATGTSFGTMALMMPLAIPLAASFSDVGVLILVAASVLDGAIFGDHCSPISETTVMSSIASECDHMEHVRTQLPYALTVMVVALGIGYVGTSMGLPYVACWGVAAGILLGCLWVFGRTVDSTEGSSSPWMRVMVDLRAKFFGSMRKKQNG